MNHVQICNIDDGDQPVQSKTAHACPACGKLFHFFGRAADWLKDGRIGK